MFLFYCKKKVHHLSSKFLFSFFIINSFYFWLLPAQLRCSFWYLFSRGLPAGETFFMVSCYLRERKFYVRVSVHAFPECIWIRSKEMFPLHSCSSLLHVSTVECFSLSTCMLWCSSGSVPRRWHGMWVLHSTSPVIYTLEIGRIYVRHEAWVLGDGMCTPRTVLAGLGSCWNCRVWGLCASCVLWWEGPQAEFSPSLALEP